jgi:hypothetical protein
MGESPQKNLFAGAIVVWSDWASPFAEGSVGTKVKNRITSRASPPVRHPTIAVQENGTYGGQAKVAGFRGPAALLSLMICYADASLITQMVDINSTVGQCAAPTTAPLIRRRWCF